MATTPKTTETDVEAISERAREAEAEAHRNPGDQDARRRAMAAALEQALAERKDETVPGGRYLTADGRLVDADGNPIKG